MTSLQQIGCGRPNLPDVLRPRGASHEVLFATPAAVFRRFQELFQVRQIFQVPNSFKIDVKSTVDSRVMAVFFCLAFSSVVCFFFGAICGLWLLTVSIPSHPPVVLSLFALLYLTQCGSQENDLCQKRLELLQHVSTSHAKQICPIKFPPCLDQQAHF